MRDSASSVETALPRGRAAVLVDFDDVSHDFERPLVQAPRICHDQVALLVLILKLSRPSNLM